MCTSIFPFSLNAKQEIENMHQIFADIFVAQIAQRGSCVLVCSTVLNDISVPDFLFIYF